MYIVISFDLKNAGDSEYESLYDALIKSGWLTPKNSTFPRSTVCCAYNYTQESQVLLNQFSLALSNHGLTIDRILIAYEAKIQQ